MTDSSQWLQSTATRAGANASQPGFTRGPPCPAFPFDRQFASDNATVYEASKLSDMVGLRVRDAHLSTGQSWATSLFQVRPSKNLTVVRKT